MTLDSLNAFTVTVALQSVLWKYTRHNSLRISLVQCVGHKKCVILLSKFESDALTEQTGVYCAAGEAVFDPYSPPLWKYQMVSGYLGHMIPLYCHSDNF